MANLFSENNYLKETTTKIKNVIFDDDKNYIVLEDNIFYAQGGGQKGDKGILLIEGKEYIVLKTIKDFVSNTLDAFLLVSNNVSEDLIGKEVFAKIDWDFRYKQMKLHSALHLHHCMIGKVLGIETPYPKVSSIEDGFAFNKYEEELITEEIAKKAFELLLDIIENAYDIVTYPDEKKEGYRWWECSEWKLPCGGTHVKNTNEIGNISFDYKEKRGLKSVKICIES